MFTFRKATIDDIDFIIEIIIESEKSNTEIISFCNIFSLTYEEYFDILKNILLEGYTNFEYSISNFIIAEKNGEYAGGLCSWIEGVDGISSSVLKSTLLIEFIGRERINQNLKKFELVNELIINRDKNTLQLEYGYVRKEFRRKGIFSSLIYLHLMNHAPVNSDSLKVQSILFKENNISFDALQRFGFVISKEKRCFQKEIYELFPYNIKIMMSAAVNETVLILLKNILNKYSFVEEGYLQEKQ